MTGAAPPTRSGDEHPAEGWAARTVRRGRAWGDASRERVLGSSFGGLVNRMVAEVVRIEPFDRGMTIAAQVFTSIVPILIIVVTLRTDEADFSDQMAQALALPDATRAVLEESVPSGAVATSSIGFLGIVVALISATSCSRALERMYSRVWQVPRPGLRTWWRWLAAIAAIAVAIAAIRLTRTVVEGYPWSTPLAVALQVAVDAAVFTFVPWTLLQAQVPLRPLAVTGVITGVGLTLVALGGQVYLPIALTSAAREFGVLGVVFAYIGWLFALAFVLVVAAAVGHACAEDDGVVGRVVRGDGRWRELL